MNCNLSLSRKLFSKFQTKGRTPEVFRFCNTVFKWYSTTWPCRISWTLPKEIAKELSWKKNKIFGNKGEKGVPSTDPLSRHRCAHIWLILLMHYLPSAGVGVDGYFAGATTMAIHCRGHFLTGKKSLYFLLGGNKLPCLCSLQGITYELCIPIYFWVWKEIFYPNCKEKQKKKKSHYTLNNTLP